MRIAATVAILFALTASAVAETRSADPGDFVILVDRSMGADKLTAVTEAIGTSLLSFNPEDRVAIIGFADKATVVARLRRVGIGRALVGKLAAMGPGTGENLVAGMRSALDVLASSKRKRKHVVVITDGDTRLGVQRVAARMKNARISISAVGFQSLNKPTLALIAAGNGGYHYVVEEPAELTRSLIAERIPAPERQTRAVVFVVDRSSSMQGPKIEAAKEIVRRASESLDPDDVMAVVTFDSEAMVFLRPQPAANRLRIAAEIARLTTGGGSNVYPGLWEAYEILKGITAPVKHVLLLTDGETPSAGVVELVTDMHGAKIVVTAVGLPGADLDLLSRIAEAGNGTLYMAEDAQKLPTLFEHALDLRP